MFEKKFIFPIICINVFSVALLISSSSYYFYLEIYGPRMLMEEDMGFSNYTIESQISSGFNHQSNALPESRRQIPTPKPLNAVQKHMLKGEIEKLGHIDYKVREKAYEKIVRLGRAAIPLLEEYTKHQDLQIQESIKEVIFEIKSE